MRLSSTPHRTAFTLACVLALLAACGGGGGGASESAARQTTAPPTSGTYAWLLKAQGSTAQLKYGLSLLHSSTPDVEFVVESGSSLVTDAKLALRGTVNAGQQSADALAPYALLYIVGGDVRSVPMEANGADPASRVQRAQSTSACSFVVDAMDYAAPQNSRFVISTAGADGQCATGDDGRAEIRFTGTGGISLTPIAGARPLGVFRDALNLAPRGWITPTTLTLWEPAGASAAVFRGSTDAPFTSVIGSTHRDALVDDGAQLSVLDWSDAAAPIETRLNAADTGGGDWVGIGFDANSYFAYRNRAAAGGSTWAVLKVRRNTPVATVWASGAGEISVASVGQTQLYVTVLGSAENQLLGIPKAPSTPVKTLEVTPKTTLTTVQTSANDVHQLWRVENIGSSAIAYTIGMIDEREATLYVTTRGGFPLVVGEASSFNFNSSENRTKFIFADGYGVRAFGDAALIAYDTASRSSKTVGTLPGSADYGADFVFASAIGGPADFMAGFAARSSAGVVQDGAAKVFSFDAGRDASLRSATRKQ